MPTIKKQDCQTQAVNVIAYTYQSCMSPPPTQALGHYCGQNVEATKHDAKWYEIVLQIL